MYRISIPAGLRKPTCLKLLLTAVLSMSACQLVDAQRPAFVEFERQEIDADFAGGYSLILADIDGDGRDDIVALATAPAQLAWYRNPDWEKRLIVTDTSANIHVAAEDINQDGRLDLVLASGFNLRDSNSGGLVHWLENPGSEEPSQAWDKHLIDEIPTSHRLLWGDINSDGRRELINLPIIGRGAIAPDYASGAELTVYTIPRDPKGSWGSVTLDRSLEMAHGLTLFDWDGDGRQDLLTASFSGVDLFQLAVDGQFVKRTRLIEAREGVRPQVGASEVVVGNLGDAQQRFLATIEPWHGNEVVAYRRSAVDGTVSREVLDDGLRGGHALAVADLDNDGRDEIIAGNRSAPAALLIFRFDPASQRWQRIELDVGGVAVSGIAVGDLNGDGFRDVVAVGSSTGNVVVYMNQGL